MELSTIEMPKELAEERLKAYRELLKTERTQQDERIARGYRVLARGLPIIELSKSVMAGGFFDNGLPKIAIARANSQDCWVHFEIDDLIYSIDSAQRRNSREMLVNSSTVRVHVPERPTAPGRRSYSGHTIMPIIPPEHRPKRNRLHLFHILWEVEAWDLTPPRDPALLQHIGGDLWSVVAAWDLTELERAILQR
jgi:hypothetical protein